MLSFTSLPKCIARTAFTFTSQPYRAHPPRNLLHKFHSTSRRKSNTMASSSHLPQDPLSHPINQADLASFHAHLQQSTRVLALLGAGLSASSGLPTFRGAGGLWRTHDAISLATPAAFAQDPGLVWQFYSHRRHMALQAQPNQAHYALAALARHMPGFLTLSQNVDGLSQRAAHPPAQLQLLHGTLFEVQCVDRFGCGYSAPDFTDPIVPALAIPTSGPTDPTSNEARNHTGHDLDISSIHTPLPGVRIQDLPFCPQCRRYLLRPGVVWFGEALPHSALDQTEDFIDAPGQGIDLILVIGTSAQVSPAAGYIDEARDKGARVCVVNLEADQWLGEDDWFFPGDAAVLVPKLLEPIIGGGGGM